MPRRYLPSAQKTKTAAKTGQDFLFEIYSYARMTRTRTDERSRFGEMDPKSPQITQLLIEWGKGDTSAFEELMPLVYGELRRLAGIYMRHQKPGHTLQPTELVNEAYIRLIDSSRVNWQSRNHFFAISAQLMRRVLVDSARRRNSNKRGGGRLQVTLGDAADIRSGKETDMAALDDALNELARLDERQSKIIELRYFGGLTEEQTAETLGISTRTVRRDWSLARAWLYRELNP
jgi:RNA polymerase sigma factor (TIGR02999 family)